MYDFLPDWAKSQDLRHTLELLYFLSGPVVTILAIAALRQLQLAKGALKAAEQQIILASEAVGVARRDIELRSKREAVQLAAERCEKFADRLIPRYETHLRTIKAAGVRVDQWSLADTEFQPSSLVDPDAATRWLEKLHADREVMLAATAMLNDLEAFAVYFVSGAADEETAYPAIGALFCGIVEALAPHLIHLRRRAPGVFASGPFANSVGLYKLWHARSRQHDLEAQAQRINLELAMVQQPPLRPIGTDVR